MRSIYMAFVYLGPRSTIGSAFTVAFWAFCVLPRTNAPTAAPPIISSSSGWYSAARWPPASANPPKTDPRTIMNPIMTSIYYTRFKLILKSLARASSSICPDFLEKQAEQQRLNLCGSSPHVTAGVGLSLDKENGRRERKLLTDRSLPRTGFLTSAGVKFSYFDLRTSDRVALK